MREKEERERKETATEEKREEYRAINSLSHSFIHVVNTCLVSSFSAPGNG